MKYRVGLGIAGFTAVVALVAASASARWGSVVTTDGRKLSGDITEAGGEVRIVDKGITQTVTRDQVKEILWQASVDELYRQKASQIKAKDAEGFYKLAEWCREQERYDLVMTAAKKVLAINPKHENAKLLEKLAAEKLAAPPASQPAEKVEESGGRDGLLSEADIQKLRFAEFRASGTEERVRVEFARGFLEKFMEEMSGEAEFSSRFQKQTFTRLRPDEKLHQIILLSERKYTAPTKYASEVKIMDDPAAFVEFRRILPGVITGCGTSGCHGGRKAPRFRLTNDPLLKPPAVYTNFFALDAARTKEGRVINRDKPESSLLLQFGLPPALASARHPEFATPIKPIFRNVEDPAYIRVREWIRQLRVPHPDYGIRLKNARRGAAEEAKPAAEPKAKAGK